MKKIGSVLMLALLVLALAPRVQAQADVKATSGFVAYNNGEFVDAMRLFNEALKNPSELKPANVPKTYYHRGMTYTQVVRYYAEKGDTAKLTEYADAPLRAMEDLKNAKKNDPEGKWTAKCDAAMKQMGAMLLMAASQGLNEFNKQAKNATPEEKKEALDMLKKFADAAVEAQPDNHMAYDARGSVMLTQGDSAAALADYKAARDKFQANRPKAPDLYIADVYFNIAMLERRLNKNVDAALKALADGKTECDKEFERMVPNKANYTPEQWANVEKVHESLLKDLSSAELDIYLVAPDKLQEALGKFEKACNERPKDYLIHVAYAQLLQNAKQEAKAVEYYKKAMAIEPSNSMAPFNMAAFFLDRAKEMNDASNAENDPGKSGELRKQAEGYWKNAIEPLEKVLTLQPCEGQALRALIQIYGNLNMTADYDRVKEAKNKCN